MKGRVLIIDDEPEVRRNLTVGLVQHDYGAVACPDGISAIHELNNSQQKGIAYDYLITDIFMPDIDGLKVLKVIKSRFPNMPVLVITAFGDERLKLTALSEYNTGYLDKPFEIPELVKALEKLSGGATTLDLSDTSFYAEQPATLQESISAYLTVRIIDSDKSRDIFNTIYRMDGVQSCEAVLGDIDIVVLAQASSIKGINALFEKIRSLSGVEVSSVAPVQRPKLDRDVEEFIEIYRQAVKMSTRESAHATSGTSSYIIIDIDKKSIQKIFTTVFFIDEVIFCDVIDNGTKLVGMITSQGAIGKTPLVIKKLKEIDGVLRVREAKVIRLIDN
ncbi:MAG: response regulator [Chitinispirillaceae bacterium]|nr:response regulator [Chitinispirillaceae bacterium]